MKRIIFLCLISLCITAVGQNRVLKHKKETNFYIPGYTGFFDIQDCYFDYNYYESPTGDYVKHGDFKISGSRTYEWYEHFQKVISTDSYTAVGKYVDGWLDGTLTITRRVKQNEKSIERKLIAGFKEGLPHGEWRLISDSKTRFVCHFKNGEMVGSVEMNDWMYSDRSFGAIVSVKGNIDDNRQYDGKWHIENADGDVYDYEFIHGVLCRYLHRDQRGNVKNKEEQDVQIIEQKKDIANQLYNKQISEDQIAETGFSYQKEDNIRPEIMIYDLYSSDVHYGFGIIGGQKEDAEGSIGQLFPPRNYMTLTFYPILPDEHFSAILNRWENRFQLAPKKKPSDLFGSYHEPILENHFGYKEGSIGIGQINKDCRFMTMDSNCLAIAYLPGGQNTRISVYDGHNSILYTISQTQADSLNNMIDRLAKIYTKNELICKKAEEI